VFDSLIAAGNSFQIVGVENDRKETDTDRIYTEIQ